MSICNALLVSTLLIGGGSLGYAAEYPSATQANQGASVTLTIDESGGNVVNPEDPDEPITPVDPENPGTNEHEGLLKINYISNLTFLGGQGETSIEYKGEALTLQAAQDTNWQNSTGPLKLTPFINIEDRRVDGDDREDGTAGTYTITAKMNEQGFSNGTATIKGAVVNLGTATHTYGESERVSDISLGAGDSATVVSAKSAIGSHSISFSPAELTIPKGISLSAGKYSAVIEWNIMGETPENQ